MVLSRSASARCRFSASTASARKVSLSILACKFTCFFNKNEAHELHTKKCSGTHLAFAFGGTAQNKITHNPPLERAEKEHHMPTRRL
jgi:hypothetical protein